MRVSRKAKPACLYLLHVLLQLAVFLLSSCSDSLKTSPEKSAKAEAFASKDKRKVLLINSYHAGLSWTDNLSEEIKELMLGPGDIDLSIEYLDTKRFPLAQTQSAQLVLLKEKYGGSPPALVIVSDNDALAFAKRHRLELFPDTPIVFCGINCYSPSFIDDSGFFTGTVEKTDPLETFQLARALNPGLKRVLFVSDGTPTGVAEMQHARDTVESARGTITISYLFNLDVEAMVEAVLPLDPRSDAVILMAFTRDSKGRFFDYEEISEMIHAATRAPVYGLWDFYLGHGVLGGFMSSAKDQGLVAGQLALRILAGESAAAIPVRTDSPNRLYVDYSMLGGYGIKPSLLPLGCTVINRPENWILDNWRTLSILLAIMLAEALALFWVSFLKQKERNLSLRELIKNKANLSATLNATADGIIAVRARDEILFANRQFAELWKIPESIAAAGDVTAQIAYITSMVADPQAYTQEVLRLYESTDSSFDFIDLKDGRVFERYSLPLQEGKASAGRVWSFRDVTERVKAEKELRRSAIENRDLLSELQHRVKNSFHMIAGLISLSASAEISEAARITLEGLLSRVMAISELYSLLYSSGSFAELDLGEYCARVATPLVEFKKSVKLLLHLERIVIEAKRAAPCGLIVTELLTNALKYAFPDERSGAITVTLKKNGNEISLSIRDDGIGLEPGFETAEASGIGMKLVKGLCSQLGGSFKVERLADGTNCLVEFSLENAQQVPAGES